MSDLRPTHALLEAYPKEITLGDGTGVTVRPLRPTDQAALLAFFQGIPAQDRWWLREDVSDPAVIHQWLAHLDYDRVLPLIALVDDRIVADVTLHRRGFGAWHHLAEVRAVVAPIYRGRGLAYTLLLELCEIAADAGLSRIEAEIVARAQSGALEATQQIGFEQVAVIDDHLIGPDGSRHDLLYLVYRIGDE